MLGLLGCRVLAKHEWAVPGAAAPCTIELEDHPRSTCTVARITSVSFGRNLTMDGKHKVCWMTVLDGKGIK